MLRLNYRKSIRRKIMAVCELHPKYNPLLPGAANSKYPQICETCKRLYELNQAMEELDKAATTFELLSAPWLRDALYKPRTTNTTAPR